MIIVRCKTAVSARRLKEECRARRIKLEHRGKRVYHIIDYGTWDREAALSMLADLKEELGAQIEWTTEDGRLSG